jgi:hypothetical protein
MFVQLITDITNVGNNWLSFFKLFVQPAIGGHAILVCVISVTSSCNIMDKHNSELRLYHLV